MRSSKTLRERGYGRYTRVDTDATSVWIRTLHARDSRPLLPGATLARALRACKIAFTGHAVSARMTGLHNSATCSADSTQCVYMAVRMCHALLLDTSDESCSSAQVFVRRGVSFSPRIIRRLQC